MENKIQKLNEYTYLIDGIEYDKRNVDEYNYLNSIGVFNKDIKIEVKNKKKSNIVTEIINDWWEVPMNTEYIDLKSMDFKTYGLMTIVSNCKTEAVCEQNGLDYSEIEHHRYLYAKGENSIFSNREKLAELSQWKINTIQKNIKKLANLGNGVVTACKDKHGKLFYKIEPYISKEGEGKIGKYVKIDNRILEKLLGIYDSTAIKVYCVIAWNSIDVDKSKELGYNTYDFAMVTKNYMLYKIGLSQNGKNFIRLNEDILESFIVEGFVSRIPYKYYDEKTGETFKTFKYKINSYEEYKRINKSQLENATKEAMKIEEEKRIKQKCDESEERV